MARPGGFTVVELAIVLAVIGLLLTGILKGAELINDAKVHSIAERQNSLRIAWHAFVDRYRAVPGDFSEAEEFITGTTSGDGDGVVTLEESPLAFQHLTLAGFLSCPQCTADAMTMPNDKNSPLNLYGGIMAIFDSDFYVHRRPAAVTLNVARPLLSIHTGNRIPSNIIAEVDRKIDDGIPNTGDFVLSQFDPQNPTKASAGAFNCATVDREGEKNPSARFSDTTLYWRPANAEPAVWSNCSAQILI